MISKTLTKIGFSLAIMLCMQGSLHASVLITGDCDAQEGTTFSFSIGPKVTGFALSSIYVGALNANQGGRFSVARWPRGSECFNPFTPEKVTLNGLSNQSNPLYNAGITFLSLLGAQRPVEERPIVVIENEPKNMYVIDTRKEQDVISLIDIKDADAQISDGIVGITGVESSVIIAAVKAENESNFGVGSSGIAVVERLQAPGQTNEEGQEIQSGPASLIQINAQPGNIDDDPRAALLNNASDVIALQNPVASIAEPIGLYWSSLLKRFYASLVVQGNAGAGDGVRAIVVGAFDENQKITFYPIAPETIFTSGANNEIVGAIDSNAQVSINLLRTMRTTTFLDYLIVQGGNGTPNQTNRSVYALPLVNNLNGQGQLSTMVQEGIQGTLANVDADPVDICQCDKKNRSTLFITRQFQQEATTPQQIFTSSSTVAQVGNGPVPAGPITDLLVKDDAVFVSVGQADVNQLPGVFHSQAIFDARGVISGWTTWQRVAGTIDQIFGIALNPQIGDFVLFSGTSSATINTVKKTQWGTGMNPGLQDLNDVVTDTFNQCQGGVQGYFDFTQNTPGLFDISLSIATGLGRIALFQTGATIGGTFTPLGTGFSENLLRFDAATITQAIPATTQTLVFQGGELSCLGPIGSADIGTVQNNAWLFVGGVCGLAVLADSSGNGWNPATQLTTGFNGLTVGMSFKKIGDFSFIRKLIADDSFLYVLTDTSLTRIDLNASNFQTGDLVATTLAHIEQLPGLSSCGVLLDMLVSQKCALLATSNGLYRVGNGANIQTALSPSDVNWQIVCVPDGVVPSLQLSAITTTGRIQDLSVGSGGNVYLVNAYIGYNQGQLNRFVVHQTQTDQVNDTTIQPFPDTQNCCELSAFGQFGSYRDRFTTDGALFISARNRAGTQPPFAQNGFITNGVMLPLDISGANTITAITRASASGSWIIAGDFGLRINE